MNIANLIAQAGKDNCRIYIKMYIYSPYRGLYETDDDGCMYLYTTIGKIDPNYKIDLYYKDSTGQVIANSSLYISDLNNMIMSGHAELIVKSETKLSPREIIEIKTMIDDLKKSPFLAYFSTRIADLIEERNKIKIAVLEKVLMTMT